MEHISIFDIIKIGVGPSSSHTMGPWRAAQRFVQSLAEKKRWEEADHVQIELFGSLAKTGKGHGTDVAVLLGLSGEDPVTIPVTHIHSKVKEIKAKGKLIVCGRKELNFDCSKDLVFNTRVTHPSHANALTFTAIFSDGTKMSETYFSIGGGFILKEGEIPSALQVHLKYPIDNAADLLQWTKRENKSIWEVVLNNELTWRSADQIRIDLQQIWKTMQESIYRGCNTNGVLPGGLKVTRRAYELSHKLLKNQSYDNYEEWFNHIRNGEREFKEVVSWVSCFALAVNEENASFGRVVTAPTNGAAGVVPAVLSYYFSFCPDKGEEDMVRFLLTAGALGIIFKKGATISAAMGGCQAEIGVSSAMAAGALTELLGGTPEQVLMAAEIAMEHHLGLTCDPIGGLVQIPCIERNAMGAMKAITASQLALVGDPAAAKVSLDAVIRTMWETAKDMNTKYKETSEGGLAINIPVNIIEC